MSVFQLVIDLKETASARRIPLRHASAFISFSRYIGRCLRRMSIFQLVVDLQETASVHPANLAIFASLMADHYRRPPKGKGKGMPSTWYTPQPPRPPYAGTSERDKFVDGLMQETAQKAKKEERKKYTKGLLKKVRGLVSGLAGKFGGAKLKKLQKSNAQPQQTGFEHQFHVIVYGCRQETQKA